MRQQFHGRHVDYQISCSVRDHSCGQPVLPEQEAEDYPSHAIEHDGAHDDQRGQGCDRSRGGQVTQAEYITIIEPRILSAESVMSGYMAIKDWYNL